MHVCDSEGGRSFGGAAGSGQERGLREGPGLGSGPSHFQGLWVSPLSVRFSDGKWGPTLLNGHGHLGFSLLKLMAHGKGSTSSEND